MSLLHPFNISWFDVSAALPPLRDCQGAAQSAARGTSSNGLSEGLAIRQTPPCDCVPTASLACRTATRTGTNRALQAKAYTTYRSGSLTALQAPSKGRGHPIVPPLAEANASVSPPSEAHASVSPP